MITTRQRRYGLSRDALILHCPNPLRSASNPFHVKWIQACTSFFADESLHGTFYNHQELTIITYNNRGVPCLLERCLAHLGVTELVILGADKNDWRWEYKISLVRDYLRSGSCRTEYVLCLDGDDALFLADPGLILHRFLRSDCQMLFCNTVWDWPHSPQCRQFEESVATRADLVHCHLNAGGYLARRSYLTARLDEILEAITHNRAWGFAQHGFSDQLAWRYLHRRYYPAMRVDSSCRIFMRFDHNR